MTDLTMYQGDDYAALITLTDPATGGAADLTGYQVSAQIRKDVADKAPTVVCQFSVAISGGQITLSLTHTMTTKLAGSYLWDLQLINPSGIYQTVMYGSVYSTQEVTRP